jgi:hypothetical protein
MASSARPATAGRPLVRRLGLSPAECAVLAAFAALSAIPVALILWHVLRQDWISTGMEGGMDQAQWVNWIRDAGHDILISDQYRLEPSASSFLHPGALASAPLTWLGVAPTAAYLVWKPFAILALFAAVLAYVRRTIEGALSRIAALTLALLFVWPADDVARFLGVPDGSGLAAMRPALLEVWPVFWEWGYYFTPLSVASMIGALLVYERARSGRAGGRWAPALALLAGWLHPLQGATLAATLVGAEGWRRRTPGAERPSPLTALPTIAAACAPLLYYVLLGRLDGSWRLAEDEGPFWPAWAIGFAIAPLALPALLAYRLRPRDFRQTALRVWPLAALGVYLLQYLLSSAPAHALQGLSVPLAVLAVTGARSLTPRLRTRAGVAGAAIAVGLLVLPGAWQELRSRRATVGTNTLPLYLTAGERDALRYLERLPSPGGVLAPLDLGQIVPAMTGRATYVGSTFWTPDFFARTQFADALFGGRMKPGQERSFVSSTGARFVVAPCSARADLSDALRPLLASSRRFGCARVWELR